MEEPLGEDEMLTSAIDGDTDLQDEEQDSLDEEQDSQLYEHFRLVADAGQVPVRVDKFLTERMQHQSRNRIQKAAEAGFIHVNERPVKSNYKVRPGDVVTLMLNRPRYDDTIEPEDIPLDVVYEDDQLMVINKPAGMVVHPGCGNYHGTLVNAVAWHLRNMPSYDPNDPEVGLVHRIDNRGKHRPRRARPSPHGCLPKGLGHREARRNPLPGDGALRIHHSGGMYTRDRTHTPDTSTHEAHRPPAVQRRAIRRLRDTQGRAHSIIQGIHTQLLRLVPTTGSTRAHAGIRASRYRKTDGLHQPAARRHAATDRQMARTTKLTNLRTE